MKRFIYADNAATTQLDQDAFEAMRPFLCENFGNPSQPYSFSRLPKKELLNARTTIAQCIGADPDEIIFTSGGTESDNWAIKSGLIVGDYRQTVVSQIEHHAILNSCVAIERLKSPVKYLEVNAQGEVLPETLAKAIKDFKTRLVSIMMVNNEIGTIEPIKELAMLSHSYGVPFHTDAVQAVGHIPINVKELNVDLLSASAHKFNGPRGIGFIYIKKGSTLKSFIDGGAQEHNLRAGTENVASIVAMAKALRKNCEEMEQNANKLRELEDLFIGTLKANQIDFIQNGSKQHAPGIINISIKNTSGEMLLHRLDLMGICVSTGSACDSVNTQLSHVIKAIKVDENYAKGTIRISLGKNNTLEDAKDIALALVKIIKR